MPIGPDCGWNPIDELSLPYSGNVIDESCIKSNTNESTSNWPLDIVKTDQSLKSTLSEQEPILNQENLTIWKDKENIVPWENIKIVNSTHSCDSANESDCKSEIKHNVSSENVIDSNKKVNDDNFSETINQHTCDIENVEKHSTLQYLPTIELQINSMEIVDINEGIQPSIVISEKLPRPETLVNGHLENLDIKELPNQTNCVQNTLIDNLVIDTSDIDAKVNSSGKYEICNNDLSIKNNNNIVMKNDQENYTDFCDFETPSNSVNVPLPNRTFKELPENCQSIDEHQQKILVKQLNDEQGDVPLDITIFNEKIVEQNAESIKINSTLENQVNNKINLEQILDSEFDEFSDFHTFSIPTTEEKPICMTDNDDFCNFETCIPSYKNTIITEHSKPLTGNDNNDLIFKSNNQNTVNHNDNINDDDNFCDFESGYLGSDCNASHQVMDVKQNDASESEFPFPLDYKQFCRDAFQGDYVSFFYVFCIIII